MLLPDLIMSKVLVELTKKQQRVLRLVNQEWKNTVDIFYSGQYTLLELSPISEDFAFIKNLGMCLTRLVIDQNVNESHLIHLNNACPRLKGICLNFKEGKPQSATVLGTINQILIDKCIIELTINLGCNYDLMPLFKNVNAIKKLELKVYPNVKKDSIKGFYRELLPGLEFLSFCSGTFFGFETEIQMKFPKVNMRDINNSREGSNFIRQAIEENNVVDKDIFFKDLNSLTEMKITLAYGDLTLSMDELCYYRNLESLELSGRRLKFLATDNAVWSKVKILRLELKEIEWSGIKYHLPNLEELTLCGESKGIFINSIAELSEFKNLAMLTIHDAMYLEIIKYQPKLTELRKLDLSFREIVLMEVLSYCSEHLPNLENLKVGGEMLNVLTSSQYFQNVDIRLPNVKFFSFSSKFIDIGCLFKLISQLMPNLYYLGIYSSSWVDKDNCCDSIDLSCNLPNLNILSHSNSFSVKQYSKLLKIAPNLTEFSPGIDKRDVEKLKEGGFIDPNRIIYSVYKPSLESELENLIWLFSH